MSERSTKPLNLSDALVAEMERNQTLLGHYQDVSKLPGVNCGFVIAGIRTDIKLATEALAAQDIVRMAQAYKRLAENE